MTSVVYVVERFPERSQTFIHNELRALHRLGIVPTVYALYPPTDTDDSTADLDFHLLPSSGRHPLQLARAVGRLARQHPVGLARAVMLAARHPTRLQLHALSKAILLVAGLDGLPLRIHAHFARASASAAMLAAAILGRPFSFTAHALDVFVAPFDLGRKLDRADVVVTVCEYNRRYIGETWPGRGNLVVIPCGVDPSAFDGARHREPDTFTIVAVGRLVPKKGFDDLVRATGLLRDAGLEVRCQVLGEGPERAALTQLINRLDLTGVVELAGAVSPAGVQHALERATVFCLPCVVAPDGDRDSQPVVVKEAMAMGLPVVGTTAVGMPEMVDEQVGRLVAPHDPRALAGALEELARMPAAERQLLGSAARARVEERFALDPLVARLASVLGLTRTGAGGVTRRP